MEDFLAAVRSLCADKNYGELANYLNRSTDLLTKHAGQIDAAIGSLDPEQHSMAFMALLLVKLSLPSYGDFELLYTQIQQFVSICSREQIQYSVEKFAHLCHFMTKCLVDMKQPMRGIKIMTIAIQKAQLSSTQLTSIHADLAQLCLVAKCFKPALPYLDVDIYDINKEGNKFDAKILLSYYYYGGMIYAALKQFDRALYFFEVAVTCPAMDVSHIMLEAYKKFILVSLILHGKITGLPKYTSNVVQRFLKPLSAPYHELATSFASNNQGTLQSVIAKHQETFARDNNVGLIKQVRSSIYKKNILRLTKTFLTLSLSDMASRVHLNSPREAEQHILHMIEDGEIYAAINQRDGMVCFHDSPEKYNSPKMLKKLDDEIRQYQQLDEKLQNMDRQLAVNPQFVQKTMSSHADEDVGIGRMRDDVLM
ncbi:COP9 signalosome complex subunit 3-like [Actinia tenebrosa]|uniref:COP9 signalosome complex subunit 3 n=1 Tax=Actinia tenebrosa TaxID=6105 RepID=A0A6P8J207_ACTTE|nr:COP9 signalosome complex subunit 3-like [Actinia tenebrosa]